MSTNKPLDPACRHILTNRFAAGGHHGHSMWLLNAVTLKLERPHDEHSIPPYAILSHTWGDDEVSFQDITSADPRVRANMREKLGWPKVENTCRLACKYGLTHVWVDTCCMDQRSSAELQESINSMFKWYEQADICIAWLGDLAADAEEDIAAENSAFRKSRWFTRGWTLQELLAPAEIDFYDAAWNFVSTKTDLRNLISDITGIGVDYIGDYLGFPAESAFERLSNASVAERLSWMADRQTKRQEDLAYCLLGIFDVNMPMLYGEGVKAFQRLQEEIMKSNGDGSLLCWGIKDSCCSWRLDESTILAPLPAYFTNSRNVRQCTIDGIIAPKFSMHQMGLQLKAAVRKDALHDKLIYVCLSCSASRDSRTQLGGSSSEAIVVLPLVSADAEPGNLEGAGPADGEYIRPVWCRPMLVSHEFLRGFETRELVIRRHSEARGDLRGLPFKVEWECWPQQGYSITGTYPPQPIGTRFQRLGEGARPRVRRSKSFGQLLGLGRKAKRALPAWFDENDEHGQVMMVVDISTRATCLVVIDYKVVTVGETQRVVWDLELNFRVFYGGTFDYETMHRLAMTQDFSRLRKFACLKQGAHYDVHFDDEKQAFLTIELSKLTYQVDTTTIDLSVLTDGEYVDAHKDCSDDRAKRRQAQRQIRAGWRKSTRRTLRFI